MVIMSSTLRGRVVRFQSAVLPPRSIEVLTVSGRDAISTPFRFELDLVSKDAELDASAVCKVPASLAIKQGVTVSGGKRGIRTLRWHGMVESFEQWDKAMDWVTYRAVLVPRLWRLSINVQSRIFLDKKVPEIVEEVLQEAGFGADDYEFRLAGSYPKREYVVQYQESDLNFLQRWCEHEGIAYWFEHGDEKEKVVFGDAPGSFQPAPGQADFRYLPLPPGGSQGASPEWYEEEAVRSFALQYRVVPAEVTLADYNYRTPSVDLSVTAPVVPDGQGRHYEYGNHYKDQGEGKAYAKARAEEIACRQRVFVGKGQVRSFSAGAVFNLGDHYRGDFNQGYLLTEVRHRARQSIELTGGAQRATASYENEFEAIPDDVPFRPKRVTPKPKIAGTMHAKVDASGDGKYADIDDEGRYKVVLPLDLSGRANGKASRYVRMAQFHSGADYGDHFPLHKDAEVILTHIDGDPDRPIISGAVSNPETKSPVTGSNQTQSIIRTAARNEIVIEDMEGSEQIVLSCPNASTKISTGAAGIGPPGCAIHTTQNIQLKCSVNHVVQVGADSTEDVVGSKATTVGGWLKEKVDGALDKLTSGDFTELNLSAKIVVSMGVTFTFSGAAAITVGGSFQAQKIAAHTAFQSASKSENVASGYTITVGAGLSMRAGGFLKGRAGGPITLNAGGPIRSEAGGPITSKAGGGMALNAGAGIGIKAGGAMALKAGGALKVNASPIAIKTSKFEVNSGGPLGLKGSPVFIEGSEATIACKVEVKKKATLNDCEIKGKCTVKGSNLEVT